MDCDHARMGRASATAIEVFADVRCPFAHVGLRRLVAARRERGADIPLVVRSWPLELVNDSPLDPDLIATEVRALREQVAPDLFAGFDVRYWPSTSMPALSLTATAYGLGVEVGEQVALAVRWALFEQGKDIASPDVLRDIAERFGLPLSARADDDRVRADWADGRQRGVIGSPHFFVGGESWFCPALDIHHVDGHLQIVDRGVGMSDFFERALPA